MVNRVRCGGFTLLEVMLVIVLLGLAFSAILPSLPESDGRAAIDKESQRLMQFLRAARDQALTKGQDFGLELTEAGYRLLTFENGQWAVAEKQRLLAPVTVNPALRLHVIAGHSVWQESLELESRTGFTFESDEETVESDSFFAQEISPALYFWSSGNLSPASIQIFPVAKSVHGRTILIEESGSVILQNEEDVR